MKISILSVFPELYTNFLGTSLVRRAKEAGLVDYDLDTFRSFVAPKERIDAPTFGHGSGMVIKAEVVQKAIEAKEKNFGDSYKVFFSPQGKKLDQAFLREISNSAQKKGHIMLLPARYEGMDARVEEYYADAVVSIGDFVLMGGDLPAMVFLEGFLRFIPGIVGKQESVEKDSFMGPFVDFSSYAEPVVWKGKTVPEVLRSGNHEAIRKWRLQDSVQKTVIHHFSWMRGQRMGKEQKAFVQKTIPSHYAALMHCNIVVGDGPSVGTSSVTSLDIHDISRSAKTFGLQNYFIVTPLVDQQKIVKKLLSFWQSDTGFEYNRSRFESVRSVLLKDSLDAVIAYIEKKEGKKPLIIVTSAKDYEKSTVISYYDQEKVWSLDRPVLFLFGTGQGLSEEIMNKADFILLPLEGFSEYNHLSVRSAAAIVFDRWLGSNLRKS